MHQTARTSQGLGVGYTFEVVHGYLLLDPAERYLEKFGNVVNGEQTFHHWTLSDEHARCSDGFHESTRPVVA